MMNLVIVMMMSVRFVRQTLPPVATWSPFEMDGLSLSEVMVTMTAMMIMITLVFRKRRDR